MNLVLFSFKNKSHLCTYKSQFGSDINTYFYTPIKRGLTKALGRTREVSFFLALSLHMYIKYVPPKKEDNFLSTRSEYFPCLYKHVYMYMKCLLLRCLMVCKHKSKHEHIYFSSTPYERNKSLTFLFVNIQWIW